MPFSLKTIIERSIEMQRDTYLGFMDYAKAFDRAKHEELFEMLASLDIDGEDLRLIRNLYWDQTTAIRIDEELGDFKEIKRAVRQGGVLSPDLFTSYSEIILCNIDKYEGMKV